MLALCIQQSHQLHQALWPSLWLEDAEERDDVLAGSIPDHAAWITESLEDGGLDELDDLWGRPSDEGSIVLEEVACDGPDSVLLLGQRREDVGKICNIIWHTRKAV